MKCPHCANDIPDASKFCNHCGLSPDKQPKQSSVKHWLMFLAGIVLAATVGGVLYLSQQPATTKKTTPPVVQAAPAPAPQPKPHSDVIVDTAFTVKAGEWSAYKFDVPADAKSVKVAGHFAATGGAKNTIEVFLTNEDGVANLKNSNPFRRFYFSGRVTQNSIDIPLPPTQDTYYLIFDNRFALMIPRAVQANATV